MKPKASSIAGSQQPNHKDVWRRERRPKGYGESRALTNEMKKNEVKGYAYNTSHSDNRAADPSQAQSRR